MVLLFFPGQQGGKLLPPRFEAEQVTYSRLLRLLSRMVIVMDSDCGFVVLSRRLEGSIRK